MRSACYSGGGHVCVGRCWRTAPKRSSPLKQFIGLVGNAMISAEVPLRARSAAGKVFQRLLRMLPISMSGHELAPDLKASFKIALKSLGKRRDDFGAITTLNDLQPRIRWSIGKTGSLTSRNFENSQSHSVVVGPGGVEERGDFWIGLTLLEAYGHVPDHTSLKSRSYFFLAPSEYCGEENGWRKVAVARFSTPSKASGWHSDERKHPCFWSGAI